MVQRNNTARQYKEKVKKDIMEIEIKLFTKENISMLPHQQQPFDIIGSLVPKYDGKEWTTSEALLKKKTKKTYPDDDYDPMEYIDNQYQAAFIAVCNKKCVGSIRVCTRWNGNGFIDDLAIDQAYRGYGIGHKLMNAAIGWCKMKRLNGLSLETQNDNLLACRFYQKYGFELKGVDTKVYTDPAYAGEIALYFYLTNEVFSRK